MSGLAMITQELVKQWRQELARLSARHPHDMSVAHHASGCATVENSMGQRIVTMETPDDWTMFYAGLQAMVDAEDEDALIDYRQEASPRF